MSTMNGTTNWTGLQGPGDGQDTATLDLIIRAIGIPLGLTILIGNLGFIVIILLTKQPRCIHTNLIVHLTVSDLLCGVSLLLEFGLQGFYPDRPGGGETDTQTLSRAYQVMCRAWAALQLLPIYHPFLLLCTLKLDRLVAITYPATYANKSVVTAAKWLPLLVWTYSILICLLALHAVDGKREHHINNNSGCDIFTLPPLYLTLTLWLHVIPATLLAVGIFLQIRRVLRIHQRKIQVTNTMTYDNLITDTAIARRDFTVAITTFLTWAPFLTSLLFWYSSSDRYVVLCVIRGTLLLGYLSSLRFIAFTLTSGRYKNTLLSLLHCNQHNKQNLQCRSRPGSR